MIFNDAFIDVFKPKDLENKSLEDILKELIEDWKTKNIKEVEKLKLPLKSFKAGIFIVAEDYEPRENSD